MKRIFLMILITVAAFSSSLASPSNYTNTDDSVSFHQVKKKTVKKTHKKPTAKKSHATKKK